MEHVVQFKGKTEAEIKKKTSPVTSELQRKDKL